MKKLAFKIDRGIPLPLTRHNGFHEAFKALAVGESFLIAGRNTLQISSSIVYARRKLAPRKFTTRTVMEKGEESIRVWRTE